MDTQRIETTSCSTCGGNIAETLSLESLHAKMKTKYQRLVLERLAMNAGNFIFLQDIVNHLYADDPNGGTSNPARIVSMNVERINEIIEKFGWTIVKDKPSNGKKVSFKLVQLQ